MSVHDDVYTALASVDQLQSISRHALVMRRSGVRLPEAALDGFGPVGWRLSPSPRGRTASGHDQGCTKGRTHLSTDSVLASIPARSDITSEYTLQ